jgi:hypothetical protein
MILHGLFDHPTISSTNLFIILTLIFDFTEYTKYKKEPHNTYINKPTRTASTNLSVGGNIPDNGHVWEVAGGIH